ncbi:MAG TPA: CRISPR-associated helicase Cas3' [Alphaproteobacteria bacterium]|nr:CRISPR-associated helicase Cas3' [Alphaproteobacteria bacterium]
MPKWRALWGKAARGSTDWHPLPYHMLDVAAVLDLGLQRRPQLLSALSAGLEMQEAECRAMLLAVLALHDVGKVAHGFQMLRPDIAALLGRSPGRRKPFACRHDQAGKLILQMLLEQSRLALPVPAGGDAEAILLLTVATGHHGTVPVHDHPWNDLTWSGFAQAGDLDAAAELVAAMADRFDWRSGWPDAAGLERLSPLLNGLFTLCDWLGSAEPFVYRPEAMPLDRYYEEHALPTAERVLDEVRPALFRELPRHPPAAFEALFAGLGRNGVAPRPTPLQALIDGLFTGEALPGGPLLTIIEDLPGAGKTEAADLIAQRLIALGRADGLYVGLPTMVTADAAFDRKFDRERGLDYGAALFAAPPQVVLAHSRRHRHRQFAFAPTQAGVEEGEGHAAAWFGRSSRRALLTELGVGTVDQALAGALRARFATLRLAGLWRKLLVVDEVHAYDPYMRPLLEALMRWQGQMGHSVVLMSATLPSAIRNALARAYAEGAGWTETAQAAAALPPGPYPQLSLVGAAGIQTRAVDPVPGPGTRPVRFAAVHDEDEADARILEWLAAGRSILWFRNSVGDAVEAWERHAALAERAGRPAPLLYHARFLPADRSAAESALLGAIGKGADPGARRGRLVIATQAAEQSLDLDADEMVCDLAMVDSVIQRLGRRRRHARRADGSLADDGVDLRPDSPVLLHMPPLLPAGPRWYAARFPRAARIYSDDAKLWLTARHLLDPATIPGRRRIGAALVLADDLRPLLEAVYAEAPALPEEAAALLRRHAQALGDAVAERALGRRGSLSFQRDLVEDWGSGSTRSDDAEGEPRTRLIDGHTAVLAAVEDGTLRLLGRSEGTTADGDADEDPVEASECRIPVELAPNGDAALVERLRGSLNERHRRALDHGRLLVLGEREGDAWCGTATVKDLRYRIRYCRQRGLTLERIGDRT